MFEAIKLWKNRISKILREKTSVGREIITEIIMGNVYDNFIYLLLCVKHIFSGQKVIWRCGTGQPLSKIGKHDTMAYFELFPSRQKNKKFIYTSIHTLVDHHIMLMAVHPTLTSLCHQAGEMSSNIWFGASASRSGSSGAQRCGESKSKAQQHTEKQLSCQTRNKAFHFMPKLMKMQRRSNSARGNWTKILEENSKYEQVKLKKKCLKYHKTHNKIGAIGDRQHAQKK